MRKSVEKYCIINLCAFTFIANRGFKAPCFYVAKIQK
mgnify:FL=1